MDVFCQRHSDSEDPISVIAEILSNNDSAKYEEILNKFKLLGFHKVKDLAQATLAKVSQMSLGYGPFAQLNSVMQAYDEICVERFMSAISFYENGNYVRSQEACEKLNALQPNDFNVLILLSASYHMQGKYEKSLEILHNVPEKYRGRLEVINNLGANHLKTNHYPEACIYYHLALSKSNHFMECWISYIITLIKMEKYGDAMIALKFVINYTPDLLEPYILFGRLLIKLKMFDKARSYFQLALQLEPKSDESWIGMGNSFAFTKEFYSAVVCYEQALKINKSLYSLVNIGFMYFNLKKFDRSIFFLKTAIDMYPMKKDNILPILGRAYLYNENISSALKTYSLSLKDKPNNPAVLNDMGLIYLNHLHNAAAAEPCFKSCVNLDKRNVLYYKNLTNVYKQLHKEDLAFKTVLKWAETHMFKNDDLGGITTLNYAIDMFLQNYYFYWKSGTLFFKLGLDHKALLRFEDARRLKPNFFLIYFNIALIYEKKNKLKDAEEFYEKALQLNPKHCDTILNLIALKQRRGLIYDVIRLYNHMLKYCISDSFVIHKDLANYFYKEVGNLKEAYNHFVRASEICDTDFDTYLALGILSLKLSNKNAALNYFWKVLELNPDCIIARTYIGYIYKEREQFNEAINEFEKVLNLQPNNPDAYCYLIQCHRHICKFINFDEMHLNKFKDIVFQQLTNNEMLSVSLQHSLLHNFESEVLLQIASTFAKQYVNKPYGQRNSHQRYVHDISVSNSCIRVGYIYTDCSSHPTSELVKSIRKLHDQNKFEVFCYSLSPINKFRSDNLSASDCCVDISNLSSIDAAKKINADRINILIDVGDSTKNLEYDIFILKPAPIQVKLLGHPGTSGANYVDFLITDEKCSPPKLDYLYTEKLAYLNRTVFFGDHGLLFNDLSQRNPQNRTTNTNNSNETMGVFESCSTTSMYSVQILPDDSIKCYTRQMYNLPEDSIVYCYFGQLYKINKTTLNMWITILKGVNNSVLWLLRFVKDAENNIHEYVAINGINPARVIFSNITSKDEHLRRIQLADIFLDTPLYNGHKSCLDALWAGTPIITLSGDTFASRMATSQLTALNCIETITETESDYIRIAIKLGTNTRLLDQIRQQIWQSKTTSVLFDCKSYSKQLENLYLHMWKQFSNQCV